MRHSKKAPTVNEGSMADIAFLLLIFFLVTAVIPDDQGINRKLARICPQGEDCNVVIKERNILRITINGKQEIMVNDDVVSIGSIKDLSKIFLDNNGDSTCDYCLGEGLLGSSENPNKAVISLQADSETSYNLFVQVQDELTKAYYELRANYATQNFGKALNELTAKEIIIVRDAYPFLVSEATTN